MSWLDTSIMRTHGLGAQAPGRSPVTHSLTEAVQGKFHYTIGPNPRGTCAMIPQFGALSGTSLTALLADSLPGIVCKIDLDEQGIAP